jgi:hypothetical protein
MPIRNSNSMITVIGQLTDQLRATKALKPDGLSKAISCVFLKRVALPVFLPIWRVPDDRNFVNESPPLF